LISGKKRRANLYTPKITSDKNYMDKIVILKLPMSFVDELLGCLDNEIDDWENTKNYLEGNINPDTPYVRECNDENEAEQLENYYREIKKQIEKQLNEQLGGNIQ